jgi:hypothetical protein
MTDRQLISLAKAILKLHKEHEECPREVPILGQGDDCGFGDETRALIDHHLESARPPKPKKLWRKI